MKTIGLLIFAPFILLLMIPLGAAIVGITAGFFGVIVGLVGAFIGIIAAFFATLFGGLFSLGGLTIAALFSKLFFLFLIVGGVYLLSSSQKKTPVR